MNKSAQSNCKFLLSYKNYNCSYKNYNLFKSINTFLIIQKNLPKVLIIVYGHKKLNLLKFTNFSNAFQMFRGNTMLKLLFYSFKVAATLFDF